jgi:hypothetical protein
MLQEGLGQGNEMDFLEIMSLRTPVSISSYIFSSSKLDMKGSHFMAPFYVVFMSFSASVRFLAIIFFMASILAATSVATLDTREDTWPLSIETSYSKNCDLAMGRESGTCEGI